MKADFIGSERLKRFLEGGGSTITDTIQLIELGLLGKELLEFQRLYHELMSTTPSK